MIAGSVSLQVVFVFFRIIFAIPLHFYKNFRIGSLIYTNNVDIFVGFYWIYKLILVKSGFALCGPLSSHLSHLKEKGWCICLQSHRRREDYISVPMNSLEWTSQDLWNSGLAFADYHILFPRPRTLPHSWALSPPAVYCMEEQMLNHS